MYSSPQVRAKLRVEFRGEDVSARRRGMGDWERFSDIVSLFYDAAFDPLLWPEALHRYGLAVNGIGAVLIPFSAPTAMLASASPALRDATQDYADGWGARDSMVEFAVVHNMRRGPFSDDGFFAPDFFAKDPYYQDFRIRHGMKHCLGFVSDLGQEAIVAISAQLGADRGPATEEERRLVTLLGRHASRALGTALQLHDMQVMRDGLADALTTLSCGAAILDASGRVVFANAALPRGPADPLRIERGMLAAALPAEQKALDALIDGARRPLLGVDGPDFAILSSPLGERSLLVRAQPLTAAFAEQVTRHGGRGQVLLMAVDLKQERKVTCEGILVRLGLTPAEARVAEQVGRGLSPREAAEIVGVRESTARFLLKRSFAKLDISRQAALARLIARLDLLADIRRDAE